jgi:hypothetical protein
MATKKIKQKQKQKQTQKQKQKQTSKSVGNIVNVNIPQPTKRQYTRRQPSKTSPTTSVQIHQLPIPQYPMIIPQILGINNLKNAQLEGELGLVRSNQINNGSPIEIGGNQDRKILTSAERADALMKTIASKQPANLLNILNEQDNNIPLRKLSPTRERSKPKLSMEEFLSRLPKPVAPEPGAPNKPIGTLFDFFKPPNDNSVEEHRKSLLKSMANHEAGLKQTNKDEDALYGYKKDGSPKKKTGRKSKLD